MQTQREVLLDLKDTDGMHHMAMGVLPHPYHTAMCL